MDRDGWSKIFASELGEVERLADEAIQKLNAMSGSLARALHALDVLETVPEHRHEYEPTCTICGHRLDVELEKE